jgi:ribosomal protein L32
MSFLLKKETAKDRYNICKNCDEFNLSLKLCKNCGCFMPTKVKISYAECPRNKWPIINIEEWKYQ